MVFTIFIVLIILYIVPELIIWPYAFFILLPIVLAETIIKKMP